MHKSMQMWSRDSAVFQTKHQNEDEMWSKWFWLWNGCWCQTGWWKLEDCAKKTFSEHLWARTQYWLKTVQIGRWYGGHMALEVRAVVWQSEGCRFNPHLLPTSWLVPYLAWQPITVGVWMCMWMGEWEASIVQHVGERLYINAVHLPSNSVLLALYSITLDWKLNNEPWILG